MQAAVPASRSRLINNGQLELQGARFDQQIIWSGFSVAAGASFNMSCAYLPEIMPLSGGGTFDLQGCYFDRGFTAQDETRIPEMYSKNIIANFGRTAYVGMFEEIEASGMTILPTGDSGNTVKIQQDDWSGGKTLHFAGREPADQGSMRRLYLDVTSADFIGQNLDCQFEMTYFIEPGATGTMNVYYDKTGGEELARSVNLASKSQGQWISEDTNMNNCAFNDALNGADIRIEIPSGANVTFLSTQVQEKTAYCSLGAFNSPPYFTKDPVSRPNGVSGVAYACGTIGTDATDPDLADGLTYSVVSGPAWLTVAADGTLSGTPTVFDIGANAFTVQVSDGTLTDTATLNITVDPSAGNDQPIFTSNPITKPGAQALSTYTGQSIAPQAYDPDVTDTLTFSKTDGPAWLTVAADGSLSGTPNVPDVGANVFTVQVSDGTLSHTATLNITVLDSYPYPDDDGNNLPDWWEIYYFGSTGQVATADSDRDGLSNAAELIAGTNPADFNSPSVVHHFDRQSGDYNATWESHTGLTYEVMASDDLASDSWTSISGPLPGTGGEMTFTDSGVMFGVEKKFYTLRITIP